VVAELLGWFGAGLSCVISLPQVVRTMRAERLDGISSATCWLVLANAAAWTAWSLLTGEYAAGIPALVNGPVAIVILHRLVATRHTARRSEFDAEVRESLSIRFPNVGDLPPKGSRLYPIVRLGKQRSGRIARRPPKRQTRGMNFWPNAAPVSPTCPQSHETITHLSRSKVL
jgi:uncharacterized protein with PQ loop repeat